MASEKTEAKRAELLEALIVHYTKDLDTAAQYIRHVLAYGEDGLKHMNGMDVREAYADWFGEDDDSED